MQTFRTIFKMVRSIKSVPIHVCAALTAGIIVLISCIECKEIPYPPSPPIDNSTPPALGHVPYFGQEPFETFLKWKEIYGPVMGVQFGKVPAVVLSDPSQIRTILEDPVLAGRAAIPIVVDRSDGQVEGVLFTEKETWLEQRDFALYHLNTYSDYGEQSLEQIVTEVSSELADTLATEGSKLNGNFTTKNRFNGPIFKILWTIFTGKKYELNDPVLQDISGRINAFVRGGPPEAELLQIVPELANFLPKEVVAQLPKYEQVLGLVKSIGDFVSTQITKNEEQFNIGRDTKNYVGKYLEKIRKTEDPNSSFYKNKGTKSLTFSLVDMIIAGSETVSTTLEWAFLYLAKNPEVQAKLHAELDSVLHDGNGQRRAPILADRSQLPYTEAVLKEILRLSSIVPLSVFHKALEPTSIGGYKVDKDSLVIANTYGVHHDTKYWGEDAREFKPERFLKTAAGDQNDEPDAFMPFGAGYRVCLGRKVAKETLFLMLAGLFQKLQVAPAAGDNLSTEPKVTQVLTPKDHFLSVQPRIQ